MLFDPQNRLDVERAKVYFDKLLAGTTPFEITKKLRKRTLPQNALFHLWVQVIADFAGYTSYEDCKRDVKRTILGMREDINRLTGEIQQTDHKTSQMTTSELSAFMDKMKIWAQSDLGCYLPYYGDPGYDEMIKEYGRRKRV